ncbi:MAG: hypothetical protein LBK67_10045 [Coriobacteriales bacterium]|jgi:hypothetical protein|nr:hypothetical protein [Coriobacteriales bacterium]
MSKTDKLKNRIDYVIEEYKKQADSHSKALQAIRRDYANDALSNQLQGEDEKHASTLASLSASLKSATDEVENLVSEVNRKLSAPVSNEALNALQVLRMRKDISAHEIEAFKDRYGDNFNVLFALQEIAGESGITIKSALEGQSDGLTASAVLNRLNDLQAYIGQIKTAITTDSGLLGVGVAHTLTMQQINALESHLDALDSYAE